MEASIKAGGRYRTLVACGRTAIAMIVVSVALAVLSIEFQPLGKFAAFGILASIPFTISSAIQVKMLQQDLTGDFRYRKYTLSESDAIVLFNRVYRSAIKRIFLLGRDS
ncbi:hypothetical protein O1R50_11590 [Glycomyces luteolus]|uniref:Uncharacterized protein n=1 Tax=Glycomyces luteolus TaxID=2670330 RepID=A0A9X3PBF1_9ACTN|nr:hypothetical protein [Glycomyces luteolus]MDA1360270.1 hypothetical protein [Glycomyces luteolus]